MKFSTHYRLSQRQDYFDKFFSKEQLKLDESIVDIAKSMYYDTMETIAEYIVNNDARGLCVLLTRSNSKLAKRFFDYFTCSDTIHSSKLNTIKRINEFFNGDIHENDI